MLQQPVAGLVAEAVVDDLEAVQVQEHQRHGPTRALRARHRLAQAVAEQHAVGQAGEAVEIGQVAELLLRLLAVGHVAQVDQPLPAWPRAQRGHANLQRALQGLAVQRQAVASLQGEAVGSVGLAVVATADVALQHPLRRLAHRRGRRLVGQQHLAMLIAQQDALGGRLQHVANAPSRALASDPVAASQVPHQALPPPYEPSSPPDGGSASGVGGVESIGRMETDVDSLPSARLGLA